MAFLSLLRLVVASVGMNSSLAAFCKVSRRGYDSEAGVTATRGAQSQGKGLLLWVWLCSERWKMQ